MDDWRSARFGCAVRLTAHAQTRMVERGLSTVIVRNLIETGSIKYKDSRRMWIHKAYPNRGDNLICAAAVAEDCLVIKTIMHHFVLEDDDADDLL